MERLINVLAITVWSYITALSSEGLRDTNTSNDTFAIFSVVLSVAMVVANIVDYSQDRL